MVWLSTPYLASFAHRPKGRKEEAMKPFFNTIPRNINCRPEERDRIKELLAVIPEDLLTQETIDAINNGDPVKLYTQPTTAKHRKAQNPLIQACYQGNILEYITTPDYANGLTSMENSRQIGRASCRERV